MRSLLVENIPQEGLEIKEEENSGSLELIDDEFASYAGTIKVFIKLEKLGEKVKVNGEINFNVGLICSRCLEPFSKKIDTAFDIIYEPQNLINIRKEQFLTGDEVDVYYYGKDGIIEVGEVVREFVILALPVKPLCNKDCRGLCPVCGKNLNQGLCPCGQKEPDTRFDKLKNYKVSK